MQLLEKRYPFKLRCPLSAIISNVTGKEQLKLQLSVIISRASMNLLQLLPGRFYSERGHLGEKCLVQLIKYSADIFSMCLHLKHSEVMRGGLWN